jgi:hypothetical protein
MAEVRVVHLAAGVRLLVALTLVTLGLMLVLNTGLAKANWFYGFLAPQEQRAGDSMSNLRKNEVLGTDWVGAAAHLPGGWTLYGSYVTGWTDACHQYATPNTLGPMAKNDSGLYTQRMQGLSYGDQTC